jgi:hypothetical protein
VPETRKNRAADGWDLRIERFAALYIERRIG